MKAVFLFISLQEVPVQLMIKGIPRSVRIDDSLQRLSDEPLQALELDAVSIDGEVAKIPDLAGLEQKLADLELI